MLLLFILLSWVFLKLPNGQGKDRAGTAASDILGKLGPLRWKDEDCGTDHTLAAAGVPTRCLRSPRA